jgi:hypothetical protein
MPASLHETWPNTLHHIDARQAWVARIPANGETRKWIKASESFLHERDECLLEKAELQMALDDLLDVCLKKHVPRRRRRSECPAMRMGEIEDPPRLEAITSENVESRAASKVWNGCRKMWRPLLVSVLA